MCILCHNFIIFCETVMHIVFNGCLVLMIRKHIRTIMMMVMTIMMMMMTLSDLTEKPVVADHSKINIS